MSRTNEKGCAAAGKRGIVSRLLSEGNQTLEPDVDQIDKIAVIGMAGRFPDAPNIERFWENICAGLESVTTFNDAQLMSAGVESSLLQMPNYVKAAVLLKDVELFDAEFFGCTPREAELTDPQHRFFLECAWEALENAGCVPDNTPARIGVFAGASGNSYFRTIVASRPELLASFNSLQGMIATDEDHLCTRVSYKLNLRGPSLTIQTACSTSLVATHIACQSLLNGECDIALAGGVSIKVPQITGYLYQEGSTLSSDGRCRAFDASANGMMVGSGVGVVVLKRLADALKDGDSIHAVILGSAINNDGSAKIGYTAPSIEGQARVIADAQAFAGVNAEEITYVETHGTGTILGDPIEVAGLTQAFRRTTAKRGFCAIGSVKTNIGHLDAAAGVTGLIKAVMALEHRKLPPSLNFTKANPAIDFANSPVYVQQSLAEWKPEGKRRIAGVSSFGIGGTNAHVIVAEAPSLPVSGDSRPWKLFPVSAKTPDALESASDRLAEFLQAHPGIEMSDVAFTLQEGRKDFECRRAVVARTVDEAISLLKARSGDRVFTSAGKLMSGPIAFMFPGQASQRIDMALEIYQTEESFRKDVDFCSELLIPHLGLDLRQVLYPETDQAEEAARQLDQTAITQPALFVIEYCLAKLWMRWGIKPEAMIGHSIGEYVAACLADVFSLQDALSLVSARGRLMQTTPKGSMLAVRLDSDSIRQYLGDDLSLAAMNGPEACVVAGDIKAIERLQSLLVEKGIQGKLLRTSHAFHSAMMDPIVSSFQDRCSNIRLGSPKIPFVSNLTGTWITSAQAADPAYWASHLRQTVRFCDGVAELLKTPNQVLLEVGPGQTLTGFARQSRDQVNRLILSTLGKGRDAGSELSEMMRTLGRLWVHGIKPDWPGFNTNQRQHRIPLPTYPFRRRRYWIESGQSGAVARVNPPTDWKASGVSDSFAVANKRMEYPGSSAQAPLASVLAGPADVRELREIITSVWREVLGFEQISETDDFFDLGGDSLLATQVLSRLRAVFRMELPADSLFEAPTIDALASYMNELERRSGPIDQMAGVLTQCEPVPKQADARF